MITIKGLSSGYGEVKVISDLNLELETGKIHGLVGLNGSGKTTFLRTIYGMIKPFSGNILLNGQPINKKQIGFLETELYFYHGITGKEYLTLFNSSNTKFDENAWEALLKIPGNELIDGYSTGMKKKLAILALIKSGKQILILDEPFNGLDLESSRILTIVLKKLQSTGSTIIITSHILESLTNLCDYVHYLKDGVITRTFGENEMGSIDNEIFHELEKGLSTKVDALIADDKKRS